MNFFRRRRITAHNVMDFPVTELLKMNMAQLHKLEDEADEAVYDAGTNLEWIRSAMRLKVDKSRNQPNNVK